MFKVINKRPKGKDGLEIIRIWVNIRMDSKLIMVRKSGLGCSDMILEVCYDCFFGIMILFGEQCLWCWIVNVEVVDINSEALVRELENL